MTTLKKILVTIYFVVLVFFNIYSVNAQVSVSPNKDIVAGDQQVDKETGLAPYRPLAPIPGLPNEISSDVSNPNAFTLPSYIRILVRIAIGIIGILSVVMIIIGGVQYMSTDAFSGKEDGKERVTQALKGLVLAVVAVFVLRTINPQLITLQITDTEFNSGVSVNADSVDIPADLKATVSNEVFQQITGKQVLPKSQYVALAKKVAAEEKIDECLLMATITAESNWRPNVMTSDADFALNIPSRRAFVNSGIKYSGATFTKGDNSLLMKKDFKNDTPQGKVDWRFSAGFGIIGITFFPEPYFKSGYENTVSYNIKDKVPEIPSVYPNNPKTGKKYTPTELMDPETSMRLGALLLKKNSCSTPYQTMAAYNTGKCNSTPHGKKTRFETYNQCKGIALNTGL